MRRQRRRPGQSWMCAHRRRAPALVVVLVATLDCLGDGASRTSLTSPDDNMGSAGAKGGGAAGSNASDVLCTATDRYDASDGSSTAPANLLPATIEAIVFDASPAGATIYPGVGYDDGTCVIFGVPTGPYLLHMKRSASGGSWWAATEERSLDLGLDRPGHPGDTLLTIAAGLTLDLSGLAPVTSSLLFASGRAGNGMVATAALGVPVSGTWKGAATFPFDSPELVGDDLWVLQLSEPTASNPVTSIAAGTQIDPFSLASGGSATLTATLEVPPSVSYSFTIDEVAIASMTSPPGKIVQQQVLVYSGPFFLHGRTWATGPFPTEIAGKLANPFTPSLQLVLRVFTALDNGAYVEIELPSLPDDGGLVSPTLGLVRNPRVDGQPGPTTIVGGSTMPTIEWDPPALGTLTSYLVYIDDAQTGHSAWEGFTAGTSVRVPPGQLEKGKSYNVRVAAHNADLDRVRHPFLGSASGASTILGVATLKP